MARSKTKRIKSAELSIDIVGLADFQRELRKIEAEAPKAMRLAFREEVAEPVAKRARAMAEGQGGAAGKTAPSIKADAEQRRAKIAMGGAKYPYAFGAEFGSYAYKQFPIWTGNRFTGGGTGYFLHPAVREARDEIEKTMGDVIERLMGEAFPN